MAGPRSLRVAARRRCDNDAVACRCGGAGTAARRADGRPLLAAPPMTPRQRRRMSPATATVPARPPPGLQPVARSRWCRLGCVSYDARSRRAMLLTSSATSLRVAVRPRATALAAPLLVRAALPAPPQLRHYALPPRRRRGMTSSYVIIRAAPLAPRRLRAAASAPQLLQLLHTVPVSTSTVRNHQQPQPHFFN